MYSLHKLQQILFKLSASISGDLSEDRTTIRKTVFSYYPTIQAVFISSHMKLYINNTFSILLLGFSSANHFLQNQAVGQLSVKGRHQASHYVRPENLMGKYCCLQIVPLLSVVITVAVKMVLLKGSRLASTIFYTPRTRKISAGTTHASQPTNYPLYVISHNPGYSVLQENFCVHKCRLKMCAHPPKSGRSTSRG